LATSILLRLRDAGCVFAEDEARLLCEFARDQDHLDELVDRRITGEPLEHLIGWVEFCGRGYFLGPDVFIPRQRSTLLVDEAARVKASGAGTILDLCCGCGALGIAVRNRVGGVVIASDISAVAVDFARRNGVHEGYVGDLFDALPAVYRGQIDTLIANTPYVPSAAVSDMPRESRDYEPRTTVDGGPDGMDLQTRVLIEAIDWLAPGGSLLTETSAGQADALHALAASRGWNARVVSDDELGAHMLVAHR
jgi:release factor glutamine methyltransferase